MVLDVIEFLENAVDEVGLAEAFELLNDKVRDQFENEFEQHEKLWEKQQDYSARLDASGKSFQEFLLSIRKLSYVDQATVELASCLLHASNPQDVRDVFARAKIKAGTTTELSAEAGNAALQKIIATYFFDVGKGAILSASGLTALIKFYTNSTICLGAWLNCEIGLPLWGNSLSIATDQDKRRSITDAYLKLIHAFVVYEGWMSAYKFAVGSLKISPNVNIVLSKFQDNDPKTFVQEIYQDMQLPLPRYDTTRIEGTSDHLPQFVSEHKSELFGVLQAVGSSKSSATKQLCKDIVRRFHMHPKSKTSVEKLIKRKYTFSFRNQNLRPTNIFPKKLDSFSEPIQSYFDMPIRKPLLFQALTTKRQANITKTLHNDVLSLLGAKIIEFYLWDSFGSSGTFFGMNRVCQRIDRDLNIFGLSARLTRQIDKQSEALTEGLVKAVVASAYLSDQNQFHHKFPIIIDRLLDDEIETNPKAKRLSDYTEKLREYDAHFSYVTMLQELTQAASLGVPDYFIEKNGPDHAPILKAKVNIGVYIEMGIGSSKKKAKNLAAFNLIKKMNADNCFEKSANES